MAITVPRSTSPRLPPSKPNMDQPLAVYQDRQPSTFDKLFQELLIVEGNKFTSFLPGQGNDPPTKFGVTLPTYKALHPTATEDTIRNLTVDEAKDFYHKNIYKHYGVDKMPEDQQGQVFDMLVNHSPRGVGHIMQKALKATGHNKGLTMDGMYGPKTRDAYVKALKADFDGVSNATVDARKDYYSNLAKKDQQKQQFLQGWHNRAERYRR